MEILSEALRRILQRCGFAVQRLPRTDGQRQMSLVFKRIGSLLRLLTPDLVIDAGANVGDYAASLRAIGYKGQIASFEPLPSVYPLLQERARHDPGWQTFPLALGERDGEATIHISGYAESSSLRSMSQRHLDAVPESREVGQSTIEMARLDSVYRKFVQPIDRIWLKLDVQGYEDRVLDGAGDVLSQVVAIDAELSLVSLYREQPLFCEMLGRLNKLGFQLARIENGFTDPVTEHALQVDAIFVRYCSGK